MKTIKEIILDAIKEHYTLTETGVSTIQLATQLDMQRSNVSRQLSELVRDEMLVKESGRPVIYRLKTFATKENSSFSHLIGEKNSLKGPIQSATAALYYPQKALDMLILGESGSGLSYFVGQMFFVSQKETANANEARQLDNSPKPILKINCSHYFDSEESLMQIIFGPSTEESSNLLERCQKSIVFIDHVEAMPAQVRAKLLTVIESRQYQVHGKQDILPFRGSFIIGANHQIEQDVLPTFAQKMPIRIDLPTLLEKGLDERLELIQHFFSMESLRLKKSITINSELLYCLLLYNCNGNIKQLRNDIRIGCANAYVSHYPDTKESIDIFVSHFKPYVRQGVLKMKFNRSAIQELILPDTQFTYDGLNVERNTLINYELESNTLYEQINKSISDFEKQGMSQADINILMVSQLEHHLKRYTVSFKQQHFDRQELLKLVDEKLIDVVETFLVQAEVKLNREYSSSVYYGLILHLDGLLTKDERSISMGHKEIMTLVNQHQQEYALSLELTEKLEELYQLQIPFEETVFIALFLREPERDETTFVKPITLICMHGDNAASSIAQTVRSLSQSDDVYHYDMPLNKAVDDAFQELKDLLGSLDTRAGVTAIYDMGSFKTMCQLVSEELGFSLHLINIPITLISLDVARKSLSHDNSETIYRESVKNLKETIISQNPVLKQQQSKQLLITICTTGQGGALQLKKYLEKNAVGEFYQIVNMQEQSSEELVKTLKGLESYQKIHAIIGTHQPKGTNIPFLPISSVFAENENDLLETIQRLGRTTFSHVSYDDVFQYLGEELNEVPIALLRESLLNVFKQLEIFETLGSDQELGLLIHIACCVDRLVRRQKSPICYQKEWFLQYDKIGFNQVLTSLKPLEKAFSIVFSDDDVANILMIIRKK